MPLETMPSAMDLMRSSETLQWNLFQEFQPRGGVRARPLSRAWVVGAREKRAMAARVERKRMAVNVFIASLRPEKAGEMIPEKRQLVVVRVLLSVVRKRRRRDGAAKRAVFNGRDGYLRRRIRMTPKAKRRAEKPKAAPTPKADQSAPTTRLERKSPTAFTAARVPKAMPCCSRGTISAVTESSRASSVPM